MSQRPFVAKSQQIVPKASQRYREREASPAEGSRRVGCVSSNVAFIEFS
jgi:hypothetical protein